MSLILWPQHMFYFYVCQGGNKTQAMQVVHGHFETSCFDANQSQFNTYL